jgi:hypothetical protein
MIPGAPEVVTCPACGAKHFRETMISGNTFGAKYYSDGKMVAPMLPEYPIVTRCHSCSALFKIKKELISGNIMDHSHVKDGHPFVEFLAVDDYFQAIEGGLCNSGPKGSEEFNHDVLMLRLMLWRTFNDIFRSPGDSPEAIADPRYQENCRAILSAIPEDEDSDSDILTLAEIHRNIGEFDECIRVLGKITDKDGFKPYISLFTEQCEARNTKTFKIADSAS